MNDLFTFRRLSVRRRVEVEQRDPRTRWVSIAKAEMHMGLGEPGVLARRKELQNFAADQEDRRPYRVG